MVPTRHGRYACWAPSLPNSDTALVLTLVPVQMPNVADIVAPVRLPTYGCSGKAIGDAGLLLTSVSAESHGRYRQSLYHVPEKGPTVSSVCVGVGRG